MRSRLLLLFCACLSGCTDNQPTLPQSPSSKSLSVHTATLGSHIDRGDFALKVSGYTDTVIATNGTVRIANVPDGDLIVELAGLGGWCGVQGENPQTVRIGKQESTTRFDVLCEAGIDVVVSATGTQIDTDGYRILGYFSTSVFETRYVEVPPSGQTLVEVAAGDHQVGLTDFAPNCTVVGPNSRQITVEAGSIARTRFDLTCVTPPTLSGRIFFMSDRTSGSLMTIHMAGPGGIGAVEVAPAGGIWLTASPDGSRLAFDQRHRDPVTFDDLQDIFTINSDGSGQAQLTTHAAWDLQPAWSPDGTRIAFASFRSPNNNLDIYVINVDGTGLTRLTNHPERDESPFWSPDGTMIGFASRRADPGGSYFLYVVNSDGTGVRRLNIPPVDPGVPAAWSPDGTRIAFSGPRPGYGIFVVNVDGTGLRDVSNRVEPSLGPSWSPDGTMLAYAAQFDDPFDVELLVITADGQGLASIAADVAYDWVPVWRP